MSLSTIRPFPFVKRFGGRASSFTMTSVTLSSSTVSSTDSTQSPSTVVGSTFSSPSGRSTDGSLPFSQEQIRLITEIVRKAVNGVPSSPILPPPQTPPPQSPSVVHLPPLEEAAPVLAPQVGSISALANKPGFQSSNWFNKEILFLAKQAKRFVHGDDPPDITEAIKVRGSSTDETKILKKIQKCFVAIHKINNDEGIRDENERFILTSIFTQYGLSLIEERQVKIFLEHNGGMDKEIQDMFTYQLGLNPKENRVVLLGNCLRVEKLRKQTQQQPQQ